MYKGDGANIDENPTAILPRVINCHDQNNYNYNINIIGAPGVGQNLLVKQITTKFLEENIKTVIIDTSGDFKNTAETLGETYLKATDICINLFDLDDEEYKIMSLDEGFSNYLNHKAKSITNFIDLVTREWMKKELTGIQRIMIGSIIKELYEDIGITNSYEDIYCGSQKKQVPTFDDFCAKLDALNEEIDKYSEELSISREKYNSLYLLFDRTDEYILNIQALTGLSLALREYTKDGFFRSFNGPTSDIINFKDFNLITFDLSDVPKGTQPIYAYGVLQYIWEHFGKKDSTIKKKIVYNKIIDECVGENKYLCELLLSIKRSCRINNTGICITYQGIDNIVEDINYSQILEYAGINIIFKQSQLVIDKLKRYFLLTKDEEQYLLYADPGDMLIKIGEKTIKVGSRDKCSI